MSEQILIVDDDASVVTSLSLMLKQAGYRSQSAPTPQAALQRLAVEPFDLVLQDMNFSRSTTGEEGLSLLAEIRARHPRLPVVLITAWGSIALAVRGIRAGASDFVTKPWSNQQLAHTVRTALGLAAARTGASGPPVTRDALDARYDLAAIAGNDPKLLKVLDLVGRVAGTDASVLVTGESGTGKELVAEAVHRNSHRRDGPFVKVNLGGVPAALFESEMFGHVRGAFTDAHRDRKGRFELAHGGTIFLDEIGDLESASQVKLLRVLQDRTFEVLGSSATRTVDVRVVSATNRSLVDLVARGEFREDLLYRLNLIAVHLPALRERPDDIPELAERFLAPAASAYGRRAVAIDDSARRWLRAQEWPGNVRQLKNVVERAVLMGSGDTLGVSDLVVALDLGETRARPGASASGAAAGEPLPDVGSMTIDEMERAMILKTLEHHGGNVTKVAESLGLSRPALYRRLEKYGIKA
jgi:two-component system, NtrC family, response regulator